MDETHTTRHWLDAPPTVAAVLVSHNGAPWLPKVIASLGDMFYAPTAWQVVDVASTDGSAEMLRDSFGAGRISYAPSGTGFGEAVRLGLESLPPTDWIWLLHDDSAVLPGTLSGLLDTATSAPDIAVVGPKIREWPSLRRLLEVGLTITSTGTRETGLETGEPDAGQHDREHDVLAVNTAGMLIRRDVWDELDGFDRQLPLFADDIDFGWRVARAGYRTRTAPTAVLFHAESSKRGTRRRSAGDVPHWEPRRAAIYTLLVNTPMPRLLFQYVRLFAGSLLRVMGLLVGKDPEAASDDLLALRSAYAHPFRLLAGRRNRAKTSRRKHREIRGLLAPFWLPYQHGYDVARDTITALVRPEAVATVGRRSTRPEAAPEEVDLGDGPSLLARRPWFSVVLVLVVVSLLAGRGLLGAGLHGGALPASPESAHGWWSLLLGRDRDMHSPTVLAPAFVIPLAVLGTPVWFHLGLVVGILMLFAVPLAALAAHRLGRLLSPYRAIRITCAVTYALCVVATGAVSQGRIGTVIALIVLPIIVNTAIQLAETPGWQLGLRVGIWIAVAAAFAPIALLLGLGGLLILLYAEGRWVGRYLLAAAGVPLALLGPWLLDRALRPWRMWWEAGFPVPGSATAVDVVLGRAGGVSAPAWLTVPLLVLAVLALLPRRTRLGVEIAWLVGLLGLVVALLGTLVTYSTPTGPAGIAPWVGVPVVVWIAGLLAAVLLAAPEALRLPGPALASLILVALVVPIGSVAWWVGRGEADPLDTGRSALVPVFLAERPGNTLVVSGTIDGGVDYRVVDGDGPFLGEEAVAGSSPATAKLTASVRRLVANGTSADIRALSAYGIDAIYAPNADLELARRIDSAPLLSPAGSDQPGSRVWTLNDEPAPDRVTAPSWHPIVGGLQLLAWFVAIVLTAPVRRREIAPALEGEEVAP